MNVIKPLFVLLCLFPTILPTSEAAARNSSNRAAELHRIYVGSFGASPDAVYLRHKLVLRLAHARRFLVVDDPATADAILSGTAQLRLVGYYNSNPRIRYRNSASVAVYDAKMMVRLEDRGGHDLWSGNLTPRFWGSQYVSDNVVNQAARHVADVLR
ncbi:exported hypothetical protein [Candidatus Sulfotelmatomonas gaucii]|uniref:Uncharacterized protein n=1 Tax=Candidatus Sulfuritelmatomonas gaucii TaxID=2043161 RepID=A0A2N9LYW4_9BACT|nr:exported hypothetical protein [Candidatus Sulfotelmatomonas gaucii]